MRVLAEQLSVRYGTRTAVAPLDVELAAGTLVALVGPNGAGKSSLLRALAGLVACTGRISIDGRALRRLDTRSRARIIAYLAQDAAAYWPVETRELVALGRLPHRAFGAAETADDATAIATAMRRTGVAEFAHRRVDTLSGGEYARAQLARALAVSAPVLLADEPVAALDPFHQLQIMAELRAFADAGGLVVVVMHELGLAARFSHRMLLLHEACIVADGTPVDVLQPDILRHYYRVEPFIGEHRGEPVIVPWRTTARFNE